MGILHGTMGILHDAMGILLMLSEKSYPQVIHNFYLTERNPMSKKLTDRQREVLQFIKDYIQEHGYPPSCRDIGDGMGFSVKAAHDYIHVLQRKGYLIYLENRPRTLRIPKCFLLLVTERVEIRPETPTIQIGDVLTIRETSAPKVGDIVIVSQNPIIVKPFEKGDPVMFGKVIGVSRSIS